MSLLSAAAAGDLLPVLREPAPMLDPRPPAIVLVDDEPDVLLILHRLLRYLVQAHALVAVGDGPAALHSVALYTVPLLITDYSMLGMTGLQLIQAVKHASPLTRTVLITAYDSPELRRRIRGAGVDEYLTKPFRLERLEQIVRESVNQPTP